MRAILIGLLLLVITIADGLSLTKATKPTGRVSTTEFPGVDLSEEDSDSEEVQVQTEKPKQSNSSCCNHPLLLYVTVPALITIPDDVPISTIVGRVKAIDPDNQKQRKIVYFKYNHDDQTFSVDEDTGVIKTRARLDTGPFPDRNVSEYMISIGTAFQNETIRVDELIQAIKEGKQETFDVRIRVLHGNARDLLMHEPRPCTTDSVESQVAELILRLKSSLNVSDWLENGIVIFDVLLVTIVITGILFLIYKERKYRSSAPPSPKCVQVPVNGQPSKIISI